MGFKYTIVLALLAFVAIQGAYGLHLEKVDERSLGDLIDKAKEAIEKLTQIVRESVENAINKLVDLKDSIINTAKDIIGRAKDSVMGEINKIKDKINKIKEQAAAVGVDIKECLINNQSDLEEIGKKTIKELVKCVTGQVEKLKNIIESTMTDITELMDTIVHLPSDLSKCIASSKPVSCLGGLIADVAGSIIFIPNMITEKVNEIIKLVVNIENNLKSCAIGKIIQASTEAAVVGAEVAKCVADKIRE